MVGEQFFGVERPKYKFNRVECLDPTICPGCEWTKPFLHFDDVGSAMLTLFAVSTTDQWMEVLYDSMDAGILVDEAPKKDSNPGAFLYFVVFICIVGFALMNLFSGGELGRLSRHRSAATWRRAVCGLIVVCFVLNARPVYPLELPRA